VDRERSQVRDRGRGAALDRARDEARIKRLANQWRAMEDDHPQWSHAFERHVDITGPQLARRAATGELPDGRRAAIPADATKWQSDGAMVVAAHGLANTDDFRAKREFAEANRTSRFTVTRPLPEVLGPGWRADVCGRTAASGGIQASQWNAGSVAVCTWQRGSDGQWHPLTCFPQPGVSRARTAAGGPW
jgi:hypothetical protein